MSMAMFYPAETSLSAGGCDNPMNLRSMQSSVPILDTAPCRYRNMSLQGQFSIYALGSPKHGNL